MFPSLFILQMRFVVILCHYDGVLRNKEEDLVHVERKKRVLLLNGDVYFHLFESQIRYVSGIRFSSMKTTL